MAIQQHQSHVSGISIALTICRRELVRFARQPARVAAAVGTPVLLWILLASGFAESLGREAIGASYAAFLLPGVMSLVAVFAAIFSSISVIEDRREGWLQSVLVSPAPRWSIALGKMMGGGLLAFVQAGALLLAIPFLDLDPSLMDVSVALLALAALSFAMAGMGLAFAWRCETTSSFHAVMNLIFLPMWMLSGAFFPVAGAHAWITPLVLANPLTWATEAIRGPLLGDAPEMWVIALAASTVFAVLMLVIATWTVERSNRGG